MNMGCIPTLRREFDKEKQGKEGVAPALGEGASVLLPTDSFLYGRLDKGFSLLIFVGAFSLFLKFV